MLRSRGPALREELNQEEEPEDEDAFAPEGLAGLPEEPSSAEDAPRAHNENERIQPVRAIVTKQHMKKMQQQQQEEEMAGSYDYEEEVPEPQRPAKKPMKGPLNQQQPRKPVGPKQKQSKMNGKRSGKFQKKPAERNQDQYDDEDSDIHALKMMRMKKLEQQRNGLSDQASLTLELLSRQNPGMTFLKQYALSNYLSHMG